MTNPFGAHIVDRPELTEAEANKVHAYYPSDWVDAAFHAREQEEDWYAVEPIAESNEEPLPSLPDAEVETKAGTENITLSVPKDLMARIDATSDWDSIPVDDLIVRYLNEGVSRIRP